MNVHRKRARMKPKVRLISVLAIRSHSLTLLLTNSQWRAAERDRLNTDFYKARVQSCCVTGIRQDVDNLAGNVIPQPNLLAQIVTGCRANNAADSSSRGQPCGVPTTTSDIVEHRLAHGDV